MRWGDARLQHCAVCCKFICRLLCTVCVPMCGSAPTRALLAARLKSVWMAGKKMFRGSSRGQRHLHLGNAVCPCWACLPACLPAAPRTAPFLSTCALPACLPFWPPLCETSQRRTTQMPFTRRRGLVLAVFRPHRMHTAFSLVPHIVVVFVSQPLGPGTLGWC